MRDALLAFASDALLFTALLFTALPFTAASCLLVACDVSTPPGGAPPSATPSSQAPLAPQGDIAVTVDEKRVGSIASPQAGASLDIREAAPELPAFDTWVTLHVLAEGGRATIVERPATAYPNARPTLRRDAHGKLWFNLVTDKGAPGPSASDVTELLITTKVPEPVVPKPLVIVTDDQRHTVAWTTLDKVARVSAKRRQDGWALSSVLAHAKVVIENDTPIAVLGVHDRLALTGADLLDDAQFVLISTNKRGATNLERWKPKDVKNAANIIRSVTQIIVGEAAKEADVIVLPLTVDGKKREGITLTELRSLPEVSSGSRRDGYALTSALALRNIAVDAIRSVKLGTSTLTGDELRADPNAFVLRRNRKGKLQLRLPKLDQRIDVTDITVELNR